jgi:hypothetical protein
MFGQHWKHLCAVAHLYICITANDPAIVGCLQKGGAVAATEELLTKCSTEQIRQSSRQLKCQRTIHWCVDLLSTCKLNRCVNVSRTQRHGGSSTHLFLRVQMTACPHPWFPQIILYTYQFNSSPIVNEWANICIESSKTDTNAQWKLDMIFLSTSTRKWAFT